MFLGLRSVIYPSSDLQADKASWTALLGAEPYFDQPFYVGFNVGGYELGLDPNASAEGNGQPITYWGVTDIGASVTGLAASGAIQRGGTSDVGGGIKMAVFTTPSGAVFGVIENPAFKAA